MWRAAYLARHALQFFLRLSVNGPWVDRIVMARIEIVKGDITHLAVDAIVNAAAPNLLGGGGVDGAIHRAAGSELVEECRLLGGCEVGYAKLTKGYRLPAPFVIHTVGPVWRGGQQDEKLHLSSCYRESLKLAIARGIKSIAFPAISCGAYGFPIEIAAEIAMREVWDAVRCSGTVSRVVFVCFSDEVFQALSRSKDRYSSG